MSRNNTEKALIPAGQNKNNKKRVSVFDLEEPICNSHNLSSILIDRLHTHFERTHENVTGHKNYYYLSDEDVECLLFAAGQIKRIIGEARSIFNTAAEYGSEVQL